MAELERHTHREEENQIKEAETLMEEWQRKLAREVK